jgi:cytochrome c-type protein NapB
MTLLIRTLVAAMLALGIAMPIAQGQGAAQPGPFIDAARGPTPIVETPKPPLLSNAINDDQRRTRSYTMQPPIIPHRVDGYQVDKQFNKCLDCHARVKTSATQAVPISVTHYLDRDGQMLAQVSTRRYFCQQCHVAQDGVSPIVANVFEDVDTVIQKSRQGTGPAKDGKK